LSPLAVFSPPRRSSSSFSPCTTLFRSYRPEGSWQPHSRARSGVPVVCRSFRACLLRYRPRTSSASGQQRRYHGGLPPGTPLSVRSEEHTSELQSLRHLVCRHLLEKNKQMAAYPADFYKIVGTATTLYDNVTMMKFLEKQSDKYSLIGLCMGEQGIISRVLGVRAGSVFTFGAISPDEKTASGQVTAQDLRSTYRIEQVDAATRVYGVAGDPVSHSLSPVIMNAALRRENVNGVFLALHAKTLKDLLACVKDIPIHGLSITMPHKETIIKFLDNTDSHTTKIGACNTVVRAQDGKLYGFNTD